jgi:hypothetical protein
LAKLTYTAFLLIFIGCKALYGIKPQTTLNEAEIKAFNESLSCNNCIFLTADTSYTTVIRKILKTDSAQQYYHLQPLQALYFDSLNNLISFHVNCNAGGFPNLNWNRNNVFDIFPPATQTGITNGFTFDVLKDALKINNSPKNNLKVVVFWALLLEKQSKRLIKIVRDNLQTNNKNAQLILVNTDALYL